MTRRAAAMLAMLLTLLTTVAAITTTTTTSTTPPPPPHPPTDPRSQVKMVTSAPKPEALVMRKDCPVYVLGELSGMRKDGEKWKNDGSSCEQCRCTNGEERCYYYYCNEQQSEGFMTPPAGRPPSGLPPPDDEDREEGLEGSGHPPPPRLDDYYNIGNHIIDAVPWGGDGGGGGGGGGDPPMCNNVSCDKICPWGYKVGRRGQCRWCQCHKCPSMRGCQPGCVGQLARDARGCHVCRCGASDTQGITVVHHTHHHTPLPHNNTSDGGGGRVAGVAGRGGGGGGAPDSLHRNPSDGTTRSVVTASPVEWWRVWVIVAPVVAVVAVVVLVGVRHWRRSHHDKYHINDYRHTETEVLRTVTTADDPLPPPPNAPLNQRLPHL